MEKLKNILFMLGIALIFISVLAGDIIFDLLKSLGIPFFEFQCTNIVTCYLESFNGTINSIVYVWLPLAALWGLFSFFTKRD